VTRIVALAAAVAAVASLAVGASGATAAERPSLADDVAARLGISPERLRDAFRSALAARIDAAVAAGRLTPAQAARLKERIANAKGIGVRKGFAKKHRALVKQIAAKGHGLGAAATYLGMTRAELRKELRDGRSLAQVAVAKGKSVDGLVAAMLAAAKERASKAVANGRLTQQRADALLARLTERIERLVQHVPARR
jgi:hypothetical protein